MVVGLITGVIGLALGICGILAFRLSERSRSAADLHSDYELPEGIAEVLAVLPSAAIVVDAGDDVVKASPAAYTYGLVRGHMLSAAELSETVARVRARGLIEELEFERARSSDRRTARSLHARVAPLGTAYVLVLCDDQTEAKRVDAVRRDFVANVSHELKTPIGAMSLLAEAVVDCADDQVAVARFGQKLQRESRRLTQLVQEIIDLSRVQDHQAPSATQLVAIDAVIDEAVDRARTRAEAKNITLQVAPVGDWHLAGNHDLIVNAMRNLIDNAINYSNEGTRVGIGAKIEDEQVAISVTDQGIGMSTADTERVFERFYRVDPARSRMTGGTGLGLSIVKHIVASHGGDVRVWSKLGQGSTFTIVLPLAGPADTTELEAAQEDGILLDHAPGALPGAAAGQTADTAAGRAEPEPSGRDAQGAQDLPDGPGRPGAAGVQEAQEAQGPQGAEHEEPARASAATGQPEPARAADAGEDQQQRKQPT
ncbi:ATP-binding protein [Brevibacterium rongguiense]|uniref:ATP-binding protein n=1 Tax=Brevibacterium rongguiense TaxID=2695267 RepID=UPI0019293389|nr:ATP-binding protein [Brevibacterium rongguiense]